MVRMAIEAWLEFHEAEIALCLLGVVLVIFVMVELSSREKPR